MRTRTNIRGRRGLTLAELIIATAMLGIVLLAGSGLIAATTAGWRQTETGFRTANLRDRAGLRVEESLGAAIAVLQAQTPAAAGNASYVFFWKSDGITGAANDKAELGEVALIEFSPTTKSILLYEAKPTSSMTASQLADATSSNWGDAGAPSVVAYFKTLSFLATPVPLIGGTTGESQVTAASFQLYAPAGSKPAVRYSVSITQGGVSTKQSGTATLRGARKPKNVS